jgi:glyoxylase-like metal-dependent hydrolase (beta-lactamase superfamily II)
VPIVQGERQKVKIAAFEQIVLRVSPMTARSRLSWFNSKAWRQGVMSFAPRVVACALWRDESADKMPIAASRLKFTSPPILAPILPFEGEPEMVPGIRVIPTPGHTPGHTSYEVESRGQKVLVWGDVVHVAAIQFPDLSVSVTYDNDENRAEATRERISSDAAKNGYWIGAAHISFPGLGHVGARSNGFVWMPTEYHACPQLP